MKINFAVTKSSAIFEYQNKKIMKTTVLGYSANGVYVEVENSFASVVFDFNTTTKECMEVFRLVGITDCDYILSQSEIESLTEAFNFLVD